MALILFAGIASCSKDKTTTPIVTSDSVTAKGVVYNALGDFSFFKSELNTTNTYTPLYVEVKYKDISYVWSNTKYTYFTFYNLNGLAQAESAVFAVLGTELPATGAYKVGAWPVAAGGILESIKLSPDEMAVSFSGGNWMSKQDPTTTINVLNESGKITISTNGEIPVFDLYGTLKGKFTGINLTKTTTKG